HSVSTPLPVHLIGTSPRLQAFAAALPLARRIDDIGDTGASDTGDSTDTHHKTTGGGSTSTHPAASGATSASTQGSSSVATVSVSHAGSTVVQSPPPIAIPGGPGKVEQQPRLYPVPTVHFATHFHPHICTFIRVLNRAGVPGLLKLQNQQYSD